jgi:membrane protease YdiL (CAAX protease family)
MNTQTVGYKAKAFEPRNLAYYFLIVFGLQALAYGLLIAGILKMPSREGPAVLLDDPRLIILTLAAWGPIIAAFVVTALTEGKPGVRALWRRFWNRNMSLKWLLVTLLILPALQLVANLVTRLLDGQAYPVFFSYDPPWSAISMFIIAFIFNGMFEEFGWRGYVLPRFQARWNALASSLILGVIWAGWHIGQWFVPGSHLYQRNFWLWGLGTILLSILMTWIFNNTKGSVLAASLFHGMVNTGTFWFQMDWLYYAIELLAVILIVIIFGPKNLVRQKPEPAGGLAAVPLS